MVLGSASYVLIGGLGGILLSAIFALVWNIFSGLQDQIINAKIRVDKLEVNVENITQQFVGMLNELEGKMEAIENAMKIMASKLPKPELENPAEDLDVYNRST